MIKIFNIIVLLSVCILINGCQSTQKTVKDSHYKKEDIQTKEIKKPAVIDFKKVNTIPQSVSEKISDFDTISVAQYKLDQHSLYKITLRNEILFATNSAKTESFNSVELKSLSELFNNDDLGQYLFIVGHTDSRGTDSYNLKLSLERALFVGSILEKNGVNAKSIKLIPAGEHLPAFKNTPSYYKKNRRVEVLVSNSSALISAYLREQKCYEEKKTCGKVKLNIFDVENDELLGLVLKKERYGAVITEKMTANELVQLSNDLTNSNVKDVDNAYYQNKTRSLLNTSVDTRNLLNLDIEIREPLRFLTTVKELLLFEPKHLIK